MVPYRGLYLSLFELYLHLYSFIALNYSFLQFFFSRSAVVATKDPLWGFIKHLLTYGLRTSFLCFQITVRILRRQIDSDYM